MEVNFFEMVPCGIRHHLGDTLSLCLQLAKLYKSVLTAPSQSKPIPTTEFQHIPVQKLTRRKLSATSNKPKPPPKMEAQHLEQVYIFTCPALALLVLEGRRVLLFLALAANSLIIALIFPNSSSGRPSSWTISADTYRSRKVNTKHIMLFLPTYYDY